MAYSTEKNIEHHIEYPPPPKKKSMYKIDFEISEKEQIYSSLLL